MARQRIASVKGTQDYYPDDWAYQKWLRDQFLSVGERFGFQEYEGPLLENMDLYLGKSSEEIVTQQTFSFKDRGDNALVLRPELTPTLARMVAAKENALVFPIRWQSYGQFFRYERPQRGRGRAFFQWNVDVLGSDSFLADAEIITVACALLEQLKITPAHATIKINDRQALQDLLTRALSLAPEEVRPLFAAVDRIDKMPPEKFRAYLKELGLSEGQTDALYEVLNTDDLSFSPWLQQIFEQLDINGVSEFVELDLKIVRGFDYYTRTVFEAWAKTSLRRALFGGGRYDNLTLQVGGKRQVPGVGVAPGDMAITELLKETGLMPELSPANPQVLVTVFSEDLLRPTATLAHELREAGAVVELHQKPGQRLDRQFRYADRKGIPFAVILGPDETSNNAVVCKDLRTGSQKTLPRSDIPQLLQTLEQGISEN